MTTSLFLLDITDAISAISISGVKVKDYDEIGINYSSEPNVLLPNPESNGFITNFSITYDTVLEGAEAPITVAYTLNYRFLGLSVGDGGNFTKNYADTASKLVTIINTLIANPGPYSGRVDMKVSGIDIGQKTDPAGNNYFGADFSLNIEELQN